MAALLDALRGRLNQRTLTADETISEAIAAAAAGKSSDAAAVEAAMMTCGITFDEFERRVELRRNRDAWRKDLERLPAAEAEIVKLEAALALEDRKLADARQAAIERCNAHRAKLAAAERQAERASRARSDLLDVANVVGPLAEEYRQALDKKTAARSTRDGIARQLRDARDRQRREESTLRDLAAAHAREIKPDRVIVTTPMRHLTEREAQAEEISIDLKRARRRVGELERELAEAEEVLAAAAEHLNRLIARVLQS